ncbi:hypothetical protein GCWU000341_02220 [Oribacterium sp. oral taxon 078 str. F0262]|nr:hypothetical protein GCWU000341_02220 [Oribacterium sp. oral taxon 078 str. F0262]
METSEPSVSQARVSVPFGDIGSSNAAPAAKDRHRTVSVPFGDIGSSNAIAPALGAALYTFPSPSGISVLQILFVPCLLQT